MPSHLILDCDGSLEPFEYEHLEAYFDLVIRKIEKGRAEYGMDYLNRSDESFREQIDDELADLTGWPAMQYVKNHMPPLYPHR